MAYWAVACGALHAQLLCCPQRETAALRLVLLLFNAWGGQYGCFQGISLPTPPVSVLGVVWPTVVFPRPGLKSINRRLSVTNDHSHISS